MTKKRIRLFLNISGIVLAVLLCTTSMASWAAEYVLFGRTQVDTTNSGGGDVQNSGEDVLFGTSIPAPKRIVPPTTAVTLKALSAAAGDVGQLIVKGLDNAWAEKTDSVALSGTTIVTVPGTWMFVNETEYHATTANAGAIRVYHGQQSADSTLSIIEKGQNRSYWAVFALPEDRTQVVPLNLRISYAMQSSGDKRASGSVAILAKEPDDNWRVKDQILFRIGSGGSPIFIEYPGNTQPTTRELWGLREHTHLKVAAAVTSSSIVDVEARFQFGVR